MYLTKIIGLKVLSIRGSSSDKGKAKVEPRYIMFDDKTTYIELDEQDPYSYHDCDRYARTLNVRQDKNAWKQIMEETSEANCDYF